VVGCHAAKELIGGRKVQKASLLFGSFDENRSTSPFGGKQLIYVHAIVVLGSDDLTRCLPRAVLCPCHI
jgi:hypothetical protein